MEHGSQATLFIWWCIFITKEFIRSCLFRCRSGSIENEKNRCWPSFLFHL